MSIIGRIIIEVDETKVPKCKFEGKLDYLDLTAIMLTLRESFHFDYLSQLRKIETTGLVERQAKLEQERQKAAKAEVETRRLEQLANEEAAKVQKALEEKAQAELDQKVIEENLKLEKARRAKNPELITQIENSFDIPVEANEEKESSKEIENVKA